MNPGNSIENIQESSRIHEITCVTSMLGVAAKMFMINFNTLFRGMGLFNCKCLVGL